MKRWPNEKLESIDPRRRSTRRPLITTKNSVERFPEESLLLPSTSILRSDQRADTKPVESSTELHADRIDIQSGSRAANGVYTGFDPAPWIRLDSSPCKTSRERIDNDRVSLCRLHPFPPLSSGISHPCFFQTLFALFHRVDVFDFRIISKMNGAKIECRKILSLCELIKSYYTRNIFFFWIRFTIIPR